VDALGQTHLGDTCLQTDAVHDELNIRIERHERYDIQGVAGGFHFQG
jgi:hypothetical protein